MAETSSLPPLPAEEKKPAPPAQPVKVTAQMATPDEFLSPFSEYIARNPDQKALFEFASSRLPKEVRDQLAPQLELQIGLNKVQDTYIAEQRTLAENARREASRKEAELYLEGQAPLPANAALLAINNIASDFAQRLDPARQYAEKGKSREDLYLDQLKERRLLELRRLEGETQKALERADRLGDEAEKNKLQNQLTKYQTTAGTIITSLQDYYKGQQEAANDLRRHLQELERIRAKAMLDLQIKLAGTGEGTKTQFDIIKTQYTTQYDALSKQLNDVENNPALPAEQRQARINELTGRLADLTQRFVTAGAALTETPGLSYLVPPTTSRDALRQTAANVVDMFAGTYRPGDIERMITDPTNSNYLDFVAALRQANPDVLPNSAEEQQLLSLSLEHLNGVVKVRGRKIPQLRSEIRTLEQRRAAVIASGNSPAVRRADQQRTVARQQRITNSENKILRIQTNLNEAKRKYENAGTLAGEKRRYQDLIMSLERQLNNERASLARMRQMPESANQGLVSEIDKEIEVKRAELNRYLPRTVNQDNDSDILIE